jgi:hypothetical protein
MRKGWTTRGWLARIRTWTRSRKRVTTAGYPASSCPPSGSGDVSRSKRLGALLYLYRGGHRDPLRFRDELHPDELDSLADLTEDDMHLANACLEVERQLAQQEFRWAERLLAGDLFGEEEVDEALERGDLDRRDIAAMWLLGLLG